MPYERTICTVRDTLCSIFAHVDAWFERDEPLRRFKPASGGWSVDQVLEHVTLTNRFLMLTLGNQWLYFLAQHARRHIQQLVALEAEFAAAATRQA